MRLWRAGQQSGELAWHIYDGGGARNSYLSRRKVHADVLQADALLQQRRAQLSDLRGRVDMEVRSAFLDLNSAVERGCATSIGLHQANSSRSLRSCFLGPDLRAKATGSGCDGQIQIKECAAYLHIHPSRRSESCARLCCNSASACKTSA